MVLTITNQTNIQNFLSKNFPLLKSVPNLFDMVEIELQEDGKSIISFPELVDAGVIDTNIKSVYTIILK